MKSREQTAIEALTKIAETSFGWDGDCGVVRLAEDALYAMEQATPPAQGSIDAHGLPPLPACKLISGPSLASLYVLYTADQMRAYVLADRAAIHSNEGLLELVVAQLKERLANADAQIERLESAARQSAAPGDVEIECKYYRTPGTACNKCGKMHGAAPAPSEPVPHSHQGSHQSAPDSREAEPVPQGVPDYNTPITYNWNDKGMEMVFGGMYILRSEWTAPTAKSGGEAVAEVDEGDEGLFVDILYGQNGSALKRGDKLYLAPPPLPATDAASVRKAMNVAATMGNVLYNLAQRQGYVLTDADCEMYSNLRKEWDAIRALISKGAGNAN